MLGLHRLRHILIGFVIFLVPATPGGFAVCYGVVFEIVPVGDRLFGRHGLPPFLKLNVNLGPVDNFGDSADSAVLKESVGELASQLVETLLGGLPHDRDYTIVMSAGHVGIEDVDDPELSVSLGPVVHTGRVKGLFDSVALSAIYVKNSLYCVHCVFLSALVTSGAG
jgi:hypothetical protein